MLTCLDCKKTFLYAAKKLSNQPILLDDIEDLAKLEHEQWIEWSKTVASNEMISEERRQRWEKCWVPYSELTEEQKENDRKWAKKIDLHYLDTQIETHVCPYCSSLNIQDAVEQVESVRSVDIAEVDGLLKEGYVVKELYAKSATMIKVKK